MQLVWCLIDELPLLTKPDSQDLVYCSTDSGCQLVVRT